MNEQKPGLLIPALIGGAVAGVLSGIPFLNCLCCLWIMGGAVLAVNLLSKDSPVSLTAGDGAVVGVLTGIAAAVVHSLLSLPLRALNLAVMRRILERLAEFTKEMPEGWNTWLDKGTGGTLSISWFFLGLFFSAAVFAALGALGGIIGVSLFGKKKTASPRGGTDAPQNSGDRQS